MRHDGAIELVAVDVWDRAAVIKWFGLGTAALAVVLAGCYSGGNVEVGDGVPAGGPLAGKPAPSFAVKRLSGGTSSLSSFRGRYVVANLWATWCTPCRHEMPALQRLSRAYARRNVVVVGIDQGEDEGVVARYVRLVGVTYPILIDSDQRYATAFAAIGLPTSVFIDAGSTVRMQVDGEMSYTRMVALTDRLLRSAAQSREGRPMR